MSALALTNMFYLRITTGLEPAGQLLITCLSLSVQIYPQIFQNTHLGDGRVERKVCTRYVYTCMHTVIQLQFLLLTKPYIGTEIHESKQDLSFASGCCKWGYLQRDVVDSGNCQPLSLCSLKLQKRSD